MEDTIVNRVAQSGLETIDLADFAPSPGIIAVIDIKNWLFKGLILKEADFRAYLEQHNWQQYQGKYVAVYCSADAVIPLWAYMLITSRLQPVAEEIIIGNEEAAQSRYFHNRLKGFNSTAFADKRVIIKGCADKPVPASAYAEISRLLMPYVKSLMFGEACSTVPVYKKR